MAADWGAEKSSQRDHLLEFLLSRNLFGSRHGALLAQGAADAKEGKDAKRRSRRGDGVAGAEVRNGRLKVEERG